MAGEGRCAALDGVGSGLVERLAASHVDGDLGPRERPECDLRVGQCDPLPPARHHRHGGEHTMGAPGQQPEHARGRACRVGLIDGLAQDVAAEAHCGVGAQHRAY